MSGDLRSYWRQASVDARLALVAVSGALVAHLLSYLGVGLIGFGYAFVVIHLFLIGLGFWAFFRGFPGWSEIQSVPAHEPPLLTSSTRALVLPAALALIYFLAVAFSTSVPSAEAFARSIDSDRANAVALLRIFSAGWIFFGVTLAAFCDYSSRRRTWRRARQGPDDMGHS